MYDEYGIEGIKQNLDSSSTQGSDLFSQLFGGAGRRSNRPRRTDNIMRDYPVSLEDLYKGKTSKFRVTHKVICPVCKGRGGAEGCEKTCPDCDGRGVVVRVLRRGNMIQQMQSDCQTCNRTGRIIDEKLQCKECKGRKVVSETKVIEVPVDPGMKEGQKVVLDHAADEAPDMEAGDIIYVIKEKKHDVYTRNGPDLMTTMHISLVEALCGFTKYLTQLDGRILRLDSPQGQVIKPGMVKVIENEGMPLYGQPFSHGSLFIKFEVDFPDSLTQGDVEKLRSILPTTKPQLLLREAEEVHMLPGNLSLFGRSVATPDDNVQQVRRTVLCSHSRLMMRIVMTSNRMRTEFSAGHSNYFLSLFKLFPGHTWPNKHTRDILRELSLLH